MKFKFTIAILAIVLLLSNNLFAQKESNFIFGLNYAGSMATKTTSVSPLVFSGYNIGLNLANEISTDKYLFKSACNFNISPSCYSGIKYDFSSLITGTVELSFAYYRYFDFLEIDKIPNLHNAIGIKINPRVNISSNASFFNASISWTGLSAYNLSTYNSFDFGWKAKQLKLWFIKTNIKERNLKLNVFIDIPLAYTYFINGYSHIEDFTDGNYKLNQSVFNPISTWDKVSAFSTDISLDWYFCNNTNAIRLGYHFDGFIIKEEYNQTGTTLSSFYLSLIMAIK